MDIQRMWAPWRMDFILSPKEQGCFLCRIIAEAPDRDEANLVVLRGERCLLLLNRYPYNAGHLMVAPLRHVATLAELTVEEQTELLSLACRGQRLLEKAFAPQGFNLGINQGTAAGAGLKDHMHLHIVPRWAGDANFMPVLGSPRVVPEALERTCRRLREWVAAGTE